MKIISITLLLLYTAANFYNSHAFSPAFHPSFKRPSSTSKLFAVISLQLDKPLGLLLEEVEENSPSGVKIQELSEGGSASSSPYKDQLLGSKILKVSGEDVSSVTFEDVLNKIINAPSPVLIEVDAPNGVVKQVKKSEIVSFDVGTTVAITVLQDGKAMTIEAKVGDNLRKTLLENNTELYRGLKKKLGNCGGAGQCTFCAVDFVESEGWEPRSDYENQKIGKWAAARLACLNNIQGPCTIRIQ